MTVFLLFSANHTVCGLQLDLTSLEGQLEVIRATRDELSQANEALLQQQAASQRQIASLEERNVQARHDHALMIEGEAAMLRQQNGDLQQQLQVAQHDLEEKDQVNNS
jgi:hypothetical protein